MQAVHTSASSLQGGFAGPFLALAGGLRAHAGGATDAPAGLHPAFLPPVYPSLHPSALSSLLRPLALPGLAAQFASASSKAKSFTIDAILGRDGRGGSGDGVSRDGSMFRRRTEGPGPGQPYVSPLTCGQHFAFRPLHSSHNRDKNDKKSSAMTSASEWKGGKSKRVRTIFTPEQLERLEAEFERQQYMVGTERYYLAAALNLTEAQVKVWFQNRRIKWRKQNLEQQHAKLAKLELFHKGESESDSEPEPEAENTAPNAQNQIQPITIACEDMDSSAHCHVTNEHEGTVSL